MAPSVPAVMATTCWGTTMLRRSWGESSLTKWEGKSVGSLVELTRKEMPSDGPGKLSRKQCTDTTAYVLSVNDFPTGQNELLPDPDVLKNILIRAEK